MNKAGLSNILIQDLMKFLDKDKNFIGVYTILDIKKLKINKKLKCTLIVNIGAHFICIVVGKKVVYYIDSFGMKPHQKEVKFFLTKCNRPVSYNKRQIQDISSSYCGLYACLFALYFGTTSTVPVKFNFQQKYLKENDTLCVRYIKQLID